MNGYLSLVLHAHLPYVRHPEYKEFLEEDWLYEAITETYIPLLEMFENLTRDNIPWNMAYPLRRRSISGLPLSGPWPFR